MSSEGPTRGLLLVVSSPSGAGKTTLCRRLIAEFPALVFSISTTTRPRRHTEVEGKDYYFVNDDQFDRMVRSEHFAEWAEVHGNRYGTARHTIEETIAGGKDVLFDIDWQGGKSLRLQYPDDTVMVFVLPPSVDALRDRLNRRATDAPDVVARRLARATEEMGHFGEYGYLIINDDLERAYRELCSVYRAERCRTPRRADFARGLTSAAQVTQRWIAEK